MFDIKKNDHDKIQNYEDLLILILKGQLIQKENVFKITY